jgi:hypothetical protein
VTARPQDVELPLRYRPVVRRCGNSRHGFSAQMVSSPDPRDSDWRGEDSRQWIKASDHDAALAAAQVREEELIAAVNSLLDQVIKFRDARHAAEARAEQLAGLTFPEKPEDLPKQREATPVPVWPTNSNGDEL